MKCTWIIEIPNYLDYFTPEEREIIELIGLENTLKLIEHFGGTAVYFSRSSLTQLKKAYVIKNKHIHYNDAARLLDVAKTTIYNWRNETE